MRSFVCVTQLMKPLTLSGRGVEKLCRKTKDAPFELLLFKAHHFETKFPCQPKATSDAVYTLLDIYGIARSKQAGHTRDRYHANAHERLLPGYMINCKSEITTPAYP